MSTADFNPKSTEAQVKARAPHLIDEPPILVYPTLAKKIGINEAIILQQLHFLLNTQRSANNQHNFVDGRWWVYNSYPQWREYFPWLAEVTIKGLFRSLEAQGWVLTMQSVKNKSDRRKWYTIDYTAWEASQNDLTMRYKISDQPSDKKYPMVGLKISDGYSESTSESTDILAAGADEQSTPLPIEPSEPEDLDAWFSPMDWSTVKNAQQLMQEAVFSAWGYPVGSTRNTLIEQLLRGVSTRKGYAESNLPRNAITPSDVQDWHDWYMATGVKPEDKILPEAPEKIQGHLLKWAAAGKPGKKNGTNPMQGLRRITDADVEGY